MIIAKPDETKAMYEKNLELMTPWIRTCVSKITDKELKDKVEITYNNEGLPVCKYKKNKSIFHITSEYPIEEAEIWGNSIQCKNSSEIFLYGSGFGYTLFKLFEKKPEHTLVVVFEQDIYIFKAMMYYFDLSPLIETHKIVFLIGNILDFKEAFLNLFYSMIFFITTYPTVMFTFPAVRNFKNEYLEIHRYVFKELSFLTSCVGNSHLDNIIGLRNLLSNTKEILKDPYLSCLENKYRGVPAFVISNGPSLDKSMSKLKKIKGKGLIISVESAIVPLTKNGINPDILAVVERTKYTYLYHFQKRNYPSNISLLALALVDPHVFPSFAGEKIPIFRQGEEQNRWFNQYLGDGSELDAGANVSHLAAAIAMYLGADPIIFVGQDLSYGPSGVTHSKDAVASHEKGKLARKLIKSLPTVYVEGNNGEMLPSNQLWANFKVGLERIVSDNPQYHFYNATEGGAKINGTKREELSKLIDDYCTQDIPCRVNELIKENREKISLDERGKLLEKFIDNVHKYVILFRNLARETNLNKFECEKMMLLCSGENEEEYKDILDETYKKNIALFYSYSNDRLCRCFFQQLTCAYFYLFNRLGAIDTKEKRTQVFDLHRQFFLNLRVTCQSISVYLEESEQMLRGFSEELNEKAVKK